LQPDLSVLTFPRFFVGPSGDAVAPQVVVEDRQGPLRREPGQRQAATLARLAGALGVPPVALVPGGPVPLKLGGPK
jgi:hypothetical protein